jgi:hypothetical protein
MDILSEAIFQGGHNLAELTVKGKLIGQGNTAEIFEWGHQHVLKLYRKGLPEDFCVNEFEITRYAHEYLKIAPKPIELLHIDGRIGAVYERLSGKTMLKLLLSQPWNLRKYSTMLARCHVEIQQNAGLSAGSLSSAPLSTGPLSEGTLSARTVKEKLRRDIENASLLSFEKKQSINEYLDTLPDGDCICHFDFHPDNIMVLAGQYYVIDWMTGCVGDPLSDVARTALILNYGEIPRVPALVNALVKVLQKRIYKVYLSEYVKMTNASLSDIQKWEMPLAAARLCEWIPDGESRQLLNVVKKELNKNK